METVSNFGYLYIFDYSDSTICELELKEEHDGKDSEEILRDLGLNPDTCSYMYSQNKIEQIIEL